MARNSSLATSSHKQNIRQLKPDPLDEFSWRFSQAFPGSRGVCWYEDHEMIVDRLAILMQTPLSYEKGGEVLWWWGHGNNPIRSFEHIEGNLFLLDEWEELKIIKIATMHFENDYRKAVYIETEASEPLDIEYPSEERRNQEIELRRGTMERRGFIYQDYCLVDGTIPVFMEAYEDGAAIINGKPVNVEGRVQSRSRYLTPYNLIIAPRQSPINNSSFDAKLEEYMKQLLQGKDVFDEMCNAIKWLPRRH